MNTEKHTDREVEELARNFGRLHYHDKYPMGALYDNSNFKHDLEKLMPVLSIMYHAGFKAAQEIQGEEDMNRVVAIIRTSLAMARLGTEQQRDIAAQESYEILKQSFRIIRKK